MRESRKQRTEVPPTIAARLQFHSDRTCCVCRVPGKPTQIHHLDGNPANHAPSNLALLCLDCHNATLVQGGFGRKLDTDQIVLYRDDWYQRVGRRRVESEPHKAPLTDTADGDMQMALSLAEVYREAKRYDSLALHYHGLANHELRDKYIELALQDDPSDSSVVFFRTLQGKHHLIPKGTVKRLLAFHTKHKNWLDRGRVYKALGMKREAARDYIKGLADALLTRRNTFSTAFYVKEFVEDGLLDDLFMLAYQEAERKKDLWWQVRALEELGWYKERDELVLKHKRSILRKKEPLLLQLLARVTGDTKTYVAVEKSMIEPPAEQKKRRRPTNT